MDPNIFILSRTKYRVLGEEARSHKHQETHTNVADTRGTMEKTTQTNFGRRSGQPRVSSTVRARALDANALFSGPAFALLR